MTTHDLVGVPLPVRHPLFAADAALLAKVKQLDGLIELRNDFDDLVEVLPLLQIGLEDEVGRQLLDRFGVAGMMISDIVLSYIVVLYSKAFTSSQGRMRLADKIKDIFGDDLSSHNLVMELRNNFYAHHGIEANRHQIFALPNRPDQGSVKLHPDGQKTRIVMSKSIDVKQVELCVNKVHEYLNGRIATLCEHIEGTLTDEQKTVINSRPREELLEQNWMFSKANRVDVFSGRNT